MYMFVEKEIVFWKYLKVPTVLWGLYPKEKTSSFDGSDTWSLSHILTVKQLSIIIQ